jgi:hypothetical protein
MRRTESERGVCERDWSVARRNRMRVYGRTVVGGRDDGNKERMGV